MVETSPEVLIRGGQSQLSTSVVPPLGGGAGREQCLALTTLLLTFENVMASFFNKLDF